MRFLSGTKQAAEKGLSLIHTLRNILQCLKALLILR
jgi:hypothetical protein